MIKKTITMLICSIMLSGCVVSFDAQELLTPPRLTEQQAEIYDALAVAIGTDTFKFKYPRRGEYLSACILRDLDNDGVEEAIAFYEHTVAGDTSTWIGLLEQTDSGWRSIKEIPGLGDDIDTIEFASVTSSESENIIVGWSSVGQENNSCVIYSYDDKNLTAASEVEFLYSEMLIVNVDDNNLSELILATKQSGTRSPTMSLIKFRSGSVVTTSYVDMPDGVTDYAQLIYGPLTENVSAVFADMIIGQDEMRTKIAVVDESIITELTEEDLGVYEAFERPISSITCLDINQDGLIDIPVNHVLLGYENEDESDIIERTEYKSLKGGEFIVVENVILNERGEYQLRIPESWVDIVTIRVQPDTGEWKFVIYAGNLEDSVTELLRIKMVSPSDYQDKLETAEYKTIAIKGENEYQAYIPPVDYPGLSITYEQLGEMLSVM